MELCPPAICLSDCPFITDEVKDWISGYVADDAKEAANAAKPKRISLSSRDSSTEPDDISSPSKNESTALEKVLASQKQIFQRFATTYQDAADLFSGKAAKSLTKQQTKKYVRDVCRNLRVKSRSKVGIILSPECVRALLKEAEEK